MRPITAAIRSYAAADDPKAATGNLIALVLAWNTPFYPFYLIWTGGAAMRPGCWFTLCSFPVFLAIPAVTRRSSMAGRVTLVLAGTLNTWFCTWLLGEASGTWLFFIPCAVLAPLLFGRTLWTFAPAMFGLVAFGHYPASPFACGPAVCDPLIWMNGISVAVLLVFFGYLAFRGAAAVDPSTTPPEPPFP